MTMVPKQKSMAKGGLIGSKQRQDRTIKTRDFTPTNFEIRKPETVLLLLKSDEQPVILQVYKFRSLIKDYANLLPIFC